MKKKAKQIKKGDVISLVGKKWTIESIETSDIGKQGTKKCRLELKNENGEKMVIIRPEDYPLDV
ncbi:MAG: hypothetical protein AABX85_04800 [Nanoarchaeota archaeon]